MSTRHRAKHRSFCVWDECNIYMDGKDRHYYPSGPRDISAPSPLYSTSYFITLHHPKRGHEDRWAIPPAFTDDNGYPVFHTIINLIMDKLPTIPLKKTYLFPIPLSILMTPFLMSPQEPSMFTPSSSPRISKANGTTVSAKLLPLILSLISSARTSTTHLDNCWWTSSEKRRECQSRLSICSLWSSICRRQHQERNYQNYLRTNGTHGSTKMLQIRLPTLLLDYYEKQFQRLCLPMPPLPDE